MRHFLYIGIVSEFLNGFTRYVYNLVGRWPILVTPTMYSIRPFYIFVVNFNNKNAHSLTVEMNMMTNPVNIGILYPTLHIDMKHMIGRITFKL